MITLWHNPRCSKSRETLNLLETQGAEVSIRKYLEDTPSPAEIDDALKALDMRPIEMMRKGEKIFKELGLSAETDDAALKQAMVDHPILIERPIAFKDGRAVIGRPPHDVLKLL